jgi:hypothetical protein
VNGVSFTSPVTTPPVTYEWSASGNWSSITDGAATGTGNFLGFTAKANTSNAPYVATITVTPQIGTCAVPDANKKTFTITVNPVPKMNDLPANASQTVCSGGTINGVTFGTPITSTTPALTYEWTADGDWSSITDGLANGTGDFAGFTAKANTSSADYTSTVTVTPKIGGCPVPDANKKKFTLTVYRKLTAGTIDSDQTICYNTKPAELTQSPASGGAGTTIYTWQKSTDNGVTWQAVGNTEGYAPPALTETTKYRRMVSNDCGIEFTAPVTITVRHQSLYNYPDLRIRVCPDGKPINLSKYVDTLDLIGTPLWSGVGIGANGVIPANALGSQGTHTFTYTVSNPCTTGDITRKVYVETLKPGRMRPLKDTIVICKDRAEIVQINQIFGIDADGTWSYYSHSAGDINAYVKESHSSTYNGAVVLNGKALYESSITSVKYHGMDVKRAVFTYKTADNSCLKGVSYTIFVILTPDLTN